MKARKILFIALVFALSITSCRSSYTVRERPAEVVYTRPGAPSANHIWVSGNWIRRGGRYVWQEGYYTTRKNGSYYVEGHWQRNRGGWRWHPGHWQQ